MKPLHNHNHKNKNKHHSKLKKWHVHLNMNSCANGCAMLVYINGSLMRNHMIYVTLRKWRKRWL